MSEIVLGIGTSHSPILTFDAATWLVRAQDDQKNQSLNLSDGRFISYEQLHAEVGDKYLQQSSLEHLTLQSQVAQQSLDRLAEEIERAAPDIVLIIGDDHEELFRLQSMPGIAIYYGKELVMHPWEPPWKNEVPGWFQAAMEGYAMDAPHRFSGAPEFALQLIEQLMRRGVDLGGAADIDDPVRGGLGHAFGFPIKRLFRGKQIPVVPMLVNTYYKPNVVRPKRCYEIGQHLRESIEAIPGDLRIAVIGSGGLSHFVTDEPLDRAILAAMRDKDADTLRKLPLEALNSGSSETLCWVVAAGALEHLDLDWAEYQPVYRTPAGSGIGLGFATWHPLSSRAVA